MGKASEYGSFKVMALYRRADPLRMSGTNKKRLRSTVAGGLVWAAAALFAASSGLAQDTALTRAGQLESQGKFAEAALALKTELARPALPISEREQLAFALDGLRRIKLDFPFTEDALFTELQKSVKNLTRAEYEQWVQAGRFDSRVIDGTRKFMVASVSNLFFRYPELAARRVPPKNRVVLDRRHWEVCDEIKKAALTQGQPYVLPKRFQVTMSVTAQPDAVADGKTVKAWLPIPRSYPFQDDFTLLAASPAVKHFDDESSTARSVYLEKAAHKGKPTEFRIRYEYTASGVWFNLDAKKVQPFGGNDPTLKKFTEEGPHVVFTPEMRALSAQIAGDETNVCRKARRFYDWIAQNIQYSYAIEYSTIPNISEYCRSHGYGDCGQEALLFITLCRLNGIPARWQSGWMTFPGGTSIHDWTEIYLAPYGWVPVDPYMGIYAHRYATTLTAAQRQELQDFYFGGLDQYRMIANSDHNQPLSPRKATMRSDNVDFQRGELESGNQNLYFDQFSYDLTSKELRSKLE